MGALSRRTLVQAGLTAAAAAATPVNTLCAADGPPAKGDRQLSMYVT